MSQSCLSLLSLCFSLLSSSLPLLFLNIFLSAHPNNPPTYLLTYLLYLPAQHVCTTRARRDWSVGAKLCQGGFQDRSPQKMHWVFESCILRSHVPTSRLEAPQEQLCLDLRIWICSQCSQVNRKISHKRLSYDNRAEAWWGRSGEYIMHGGDVWQRREGRV
jgi:hypothetical protein